ncbi:MAG: ABC transporter permease [Lachnospiraceae bacterium]|nr:ABC transporter permease [Lachnospiraceae bacterium]
MSFIKRAGLYCLRQRFKTVILFLVLTLIATFMLTGIAIRDAAKGAIADVQTAIGGKMMLDIDMDGHMGGGQQNEWGMAYTYNGDLITEEIVDAIEKVDGVVDYNVEETEGYYGAGVNFKYLPVALGLSYTQYGEASSYTATLSSEKCKAFQSGKYKLVEGRHITSDDKYTCLISKELADYNKLSVGDTIKMYSLDSDAISEFEIVGIFDGTEGVSGNALTVDEIPANCGYVDYAGVQDIFKDIDDENGYQQLTIYVEDPVSIQNVYDKISALPELKGKTLKLTIDTDEYDAVSRPLESLQKLVNTTIIIISVVSVVILTLLLTIWIRGRKKEIGILLSIGKSKANIILQIFTETFVVAVISFAASIPFSFSVAEKAGEFLVSRVGTGTANLNMQIDATYLLPLYMIGILLIAVAVIASSWTVVCRKPKDILTKMN